MEILKRYTLEELKESTGDFCEGRINEKSSYSWDYSAVLVDDEETVVKKLNIDIDHDSDADFLAQLAVVSALNNEYLTGLLGYCMEDENRYLVYQCSTPLNELLRGEESIGNALSWEQRVIYSYAAAKGLEYLHEEVTPSIVHGDVRPSNVFVFDYWTCKIADFNLTRALTDDNAPRTLPIRAPGSYGYDAPECATTGELTVKSDVYSFGVLLLEMLTGRKPVDDTLPEEEQDLVTWATPYLSDDKVEHIVDPRLGHYFPLEPVAKVAALARLCIQDEPDFRPNMAIIAGALKPLFKDRESASTEVTIAQSYKYFDLEELNSATNNFSQMSLVAKGPYAQVFRALFSDGQQAAIKKLDTSIPQCSDYDFEAQLHLVPFLRHEHLIEPLGVFRDDVDRYLVYEFATKGSLHDMLYGRKHVYGSVPGPVLTWAQRAKIAYGAAKGLEYLHDTADPPIVHGDIRSSNVLLTQGVSDDYYPKIGDFNFTHVRHIYGIDGYRGPKDALEKLNPKNDVYDFGVVLLELITGRKPIDNTMPEEQQDLVTWAIPYLSAENVEQIIDPKLNDFPLDEVAKMAAIAGLCIQDELNSRPVIYTLVKALKTLVEA